jgi:4'-phosphopantetheinyl transferase EntD
MIGLILPVGAVCVDAYGSDWGSVLLPEELAVVADATEPRRTEFAAGRCCAREALSRLGHPGSPILRGPHREPLWPEGIVGSITHSADYCAAAVAAQRDILSLGIDAEVNATLPDGVVQLTMTELEAGQIDRMTGVHACALIFSAKEALFKAWFPLGRTWLGHHDVEIELEEDRPVFSIHLSPRVRDQLPRSVTFSGRFAATERHILTAVTAAVPGEPDVSTQVGHGP